MTVFLTERHITGFHYYNHCNISIVSTVRPIYEVIFGERIGAFSVSLFDIL